MFKQKISITINSGFDRDKLFEEFETLMSNLCKTGQIIADYETPFVAGNELISFQTTMEKGSLSKKYYDEYVIQRVKNLEQWCNAKLKTEVAGISIPDYKGVCNCKKPGLYILFTYVLNDSGMIDCGTCNKIVPLYKLTHLNYQDRYDILKWERDYKSCDSLQLGCTVGEKWATKQMSDPTSQLSKQGIEICNRIRKITRIPAYYYLYNYRHISHDRDKARLCPSCNGKWLLRERLLDFYDFKCDKCRLLSSFSPVTN
jgi:predicted  nucleic acid-binding Zn ribbon protein